MTDWKGTVMSGEQMSEEIQTKAKKWSICNPAFIEDIAHIIAKRQAEISFPLGEKQGIKKVVEDFATVLDAPAHYRLGMFFDILDTWQAFLKELGIKEEK